MHDERERGSTDPIPVIRDPAHAPKVVVVDADFPGRLSSLERTVAFWRRITWGAATFALASVVAVIGFAYDRGGDDREAVFRMQQLERDRDKAEVRDQEQDRRLLDLERRRRSFDAPASPSSVPSTYLPGATL